MILIPLNLQTFQKCSKTARSYEVVTAPSSPTHLLPIKPGFAWIVRGGRAISPENHKYKSKIHPDYVKIINMIAKNHIL